MPSHIIVRTWFVASCLVIPPFFSIVEALSSFAFESYSCEVFNRDFTGLFFIISASRAKRVGRNGSRYVQSEYGDAVAATSNSKCNGRSTEKDTERTEPVGTNRPNASHTANDDANATSAGPDANDAYQFVHYCHVNRFSRHCRDQHWSNTSNEQLSSIQGGKAEIWCNKVGSCPFFIRGYR